MIPPLPTLLREILESLNCQVDIASEGKKALELFQKKSYDLVFMDIGLPDIDGYEATKRIRALEWNKDNPIPIIALSAHTGIEKKQLCIDAGMNAVLTKPLARDKAEDIINAFIPSRSNELGAKSNLAATGTSSGTAVQEDLLTIQGKVLDIEGVAEHIGLKPDMIRKMFKTFLESLKQDEAALVNSYRNKNWNAVADVAHKLKGASHYCGAMRVHQASHRLEKYIEEHGAAEMTEALYNQLLRELETVKKKPKKQEAA